MFPSYPAESAHVPARLLFPAACPSPSAAPPRVLPGCCPGAACCLGVDHGALSLHGIDAAAGVVVVVAAVVVAAAAGVVVAAAVVAAVAVGAVAVAPVVVAPVAAVAGVVVS